MQLIETPDILIRLATAAVLGAAVGLERERKEWVAGIRTHTLVAMGAALAMIVSTYGFTDVLGKEGYMLDPSRIAAQVISGVGFLGAGTILFLRQEVIRGLTTAAALWSVAAVGLAAGSGMYIAALAATVLILFVLAGIKWMEKKWFNKQEAQSIEISVQKDAAVSVSDLEQILRKNKIEVKRFTLTADEIGQLDHIAITFSKFSRRKDLMLAFEEIKNQKGVVKVDL